MSGRPSPLKSATAMPMVCERQVLLLQAPDVFRAVSEKEAWLDAVAALDGFAAQPDEERLVALEGGDEALVDRPLATIGRALQEVEDGDEGALGVLALLAALPARTSALAPQCRRRWRLVEPSERFRRARRR